MKKLKRLFDYQTIEKNEALEELISDTHSRYSPNIIELSDDSLEMVSAGVERAIREKKKEEK